MMSASSNHNNRNINNLANSGSNKQGDPQQQQDFGFVGGDPSYEDWACSDFNLFDFVGHDESPFETPRDGEDFDLSEPDDLHKKDMVYQALQYNALQLDPPMDNNSFHSPPPFEQSQKMQQQPMTSGSSSYAQLPSRSSASSSYASINNGVIPISMVNTPSMMPSTSRHMLSTPVAIKEEPISEYAQYEESEVSDMQSRPESVLDDSGIGPMRGNKTTRKYRTKSDAEKKNPVYRVKREKNNDAVRRSRDKSRKLQEEKEERLYYLEREDLNKSKIIAQLKSRNDLLTELLKKKDEDFMSFKRNCTCRRAKHT